MAIFHFLLCATLLSEFAQFNFGAPITIPDIPSVGCLDYPSTQHCPAFEVFRCCYQGFDQECACKSDNDQVLSKGLSEAVILNKRSHSHSLTVDQVKQRPSRYYSNYYCNVDTKATSLVLTSQDIKMTSCIDIRSLYSARHDPGCDACCLLVWCFRTEVLGLPY